MKIKTREAVTIRHCRRLARECDFARLRYASDGDLNTIWVEMYAAHVSESLRAWIINEWEKRFLLV